MPLYDIFPLKKDLENTEILQDVVDFWIAKERSISETLDETLPKKKLKPVAYCPDLASAELVKKALNSSRQSASKDYNVIAREVKFQDALENLLSTDLSLLTTYQGILSRAELKSVGRRN